MKVDEEKFTCLIHLGILNDPYECIKCKNNFCKSCINEHLKKQNKCPLCSESPFIFRENEFLQRVLKDIKFICQNCGKSFKNEDEYNTHIESCIIEKYVCIICENEFNENNFYEHIINTHKSDIISLMNQKSMINKLNYKYNKEEFINQKKLNLKISIFNHQNKEEYKKSLNSQHKNNKINLFENLSKNKKNLIIKKLPLENINDNFGLNDYNFQNYNEIQHAEIQNRVPLININENFSLNDYNFPNYNEIQQVENQREKNEKISKLNLDRIDTFYNNNVSSIRTQRVNTTYVKNNKKNDSFYENINTERLSNSTTQNFNNIKYCNQENKIPCSCCKDHICRPGNCLCKKCMLINIKELKLQKGQLINKKGYICNFERNTFYCNQPFVKTTVNIKKNIFKTNLICGIYTPCPECEILTKLKNFYLN